MILFLSSNDNLSYCKRIVMNTAVGLKNFFFNKLDLVQMITQSVSVLLFLLFPLGAATADYPYASNPILYVFLCHIDRPCMSFLTTSINLILGLPRILFPGSSILSILLPIYLISLVCTCLNYFNLRKHCLSLLQIPHWNKFITMALYDLFHIIQSFFSLSFSTFISSSKCFFHLHQLFSLTNSRLHRLSP